MKTAGNLIAFTTEFTASMQDRKNDLNRWNLLFWMLINRDTATIIINGDRIVFMYGYHDVGAIASERFIDCVVNNLIYEMMKTTRAR